MDDVTVNMCSYERAHIYKIVKTEFLGRVFKSFFMIPIPLFAFKIFALI